MISRYFSPLFLGVPFVTAYLNNIAFLLLFRHQQKKTTFTQYPNRIIIQSERYEKYI